MIWNPAQGRQALSAVTAIVVAMAVIAVVLTAAHLVAARDAQKANVLWYAEGGGLMTIADRVRLADIDSSVESSGRISDADIDWMLHLLAGPPVTRGPFTVPNLHTAILDIPLNFVRDFTAAQRAKLYAAAQPLITSGYVNDRALAAEMLGRSENPLALREVRSLLADPDAAVRRYARRALRELQ